MIELIILASDINRLWKKVNILGPDDCWDWFGALSGRGYGVISVDYRTLGTHTFSWMIDNNTNKVPYGMYILHRCDNRKCCNPKHIYCGTPSDNACDREERNPKKPYQDASKSKLFSHEILELRKLTGMTQEEKARKYNIDQTSVSKILRAPVYLCKEGYYI
jgi:hypothetical protein